jgi:6-phosphogluconate dehydrogenase
MQLICEAYHLMKDALGMSCDEMGAVFTEWNKGEVQPMPRRITHHTQTRTHSPCIAQLSQPGL